MNNFYNLQFLVSLDKCIKLVIPNNKIIVQKLLTLCLEQLLLVWLFFSYE
jgi:hypothetical protein